MNEETIDLRQALPALIARYDGRLPIIEAICSGQCPRDRLQLIGARLYAETRCALQIRHPERLRICPLDAELARRFWWRQIADESGNFEPGQDHASLIAVTCRAMGISQRDLDLEYELHLPRIESIRQEPISIETTLREATEIYVEEAVFVNTANRIGDALRDHYGIPEEAVYYFRLHAVVDVDHSNAGLDMLAHYATTQVQKELVLQKAEHDLKRFPIWADET